MRKMISFKLENLPDKQRKVIDDWANGQSNIQQSLTNVVQHVVSLIGNDDVMDFDVQRKLHVLFGNGVHVSEKVVEVQHEPVYHEPLPRKIDTKPKTVEEDVYAKADWFNEDE